MYWLAIFCPLVSLILACISANLCSSLSEIGEDTDFAEDAFATGVLAVAVVVVVELFEGNGDVGICLVVELGDSGIDGWWV